jgi:hypothetical protein
MWRNIYCTVQEKKGKYSHPIWEKFFFSSSIKFLSVSYFNFVFGWNEWKWACFTLVNTLSDYFAMMQFCCSFGFDISYRVWRTNDLKYMFVCILRKCYCLNDAGSIMVLRGGSFSVSIVVIIFYFFYFLSHILCS